MGVDNPPQISSAVVGSLSAAKGIASRCGVNMQGGTISGTTTGETLRQDHLCLANCDSLRLVLSNCIGGGRIVNANAITVAASIEDPVGNPQQVTFDGAPTITLQSGETVISDPLGIGFSNGDRIRSRVFQQVAVNAQTVPCGAVTATSPYVDGFEAGNQTMAASPSWAGDGNFHYGPSAIVADYTDARCQVVIPGDSVAAGQNDSNSNYDIRGWVLRALNNQWPYTMLAVPGDAASQFKPPTSAAPSTSRYPRVPLLGAGTHSVVNYGANDVGSATVAALQDNLLRVWRAQKLRGQTVIAATIPPSGVTSTDGFVTLVNQTVNVNDATRTGVNDWVRGGAPIDPTALTAVAVGTPGALVFGTAPHPADAFWEAADPVESSRNSGKWQVSGGAITDGTHPNGTGAALIAANCDVTKLGPKAPGASTPIPANNPPGIFAASLFAWYPVASIVGLTDGTAVASWPDNSGNGRPLLQATGANKPLFKTNINFSAPAVRFDGAASFMAATMTLTQPFELWMVAHFTSLNGTSNSFLFGAHPGSLYGFRAGPGSTQAALTEQGSANFAGGFTTDVLAAFHAWGALADGASSVIYEDATTYGAGDMGTSIVSALTVGASRSDVGLSFAAIDVQEALILNRASTAPERVLLHDYFISTYGTP
jgi:lysophospholipase L1-like esterase